LRIPTTVAGIGVINKRVHAWDRRGFHIITLAGGGVICKRKRRGCQCRWR